VKIPRHVLSAIAVSVIWFAIGAASGWNILIAPSGGPQGFFDPNNIEIWLICGLIPALLGGVFVWAFYRLKEGGKKSGD